MNLLFERLKIQANLRRLIDELGAEPAIRLFDQAIERELKQELRKQQDLQE
jgi:hypothetical protein